MTTPTEGLTDALRALQGVSPGVSAVVLSSVEGRILASTSLTGMEKVQISAVSAASLAIAGKGTRDLQLGDLKLVHIKGEHGSIVLVGVGRKALLTLIITGEINMDSVLWEARRTAARLETIIQL